MDRTIIDVRRGEEKELSENIFTTLEHLTILYKPTEQFRAFLTEDMFVKQNVKALPHVMHYLFTILDAAEFKKRFYWPLLDKNAEALFRTTTIQYLNYLNEKHKLGWVQIKSFLVVMPGGMKFMKFLSSLIDFVISEENKKLLSSVTGQMHDNFKFTKGSFKKLVKEKENFIKNATQYKETIEKQKHLLLEKTSLLNLKLSEYCKTLNIPPSAIVDDMFLESLKANNMKLLKEDFEKQINSIQSLEEPINKLEKNTETFQNEKTEFPCDKSILLKSYKDIQRNFPELSNEEIIINDQINVQCLLSVFNNLYPFIDHTLEDCNNIRSEDSLIFEEEAATKLMNDAIQLHAEYLQYENSLQNCIKDNKDLVKSDARSVLPSYLKSRIINTPPIRFDLSRAERFKKRLPLWDEFNCTNRDTSFTFSNQTTFCAPKSAKKSEKKKDRFLDSANTSKIMDPEMLLRTLTKKKDQRSRTDSKNLTELASKYKERESMMWGDSSFSNRTEANTILKNNIVTTPAMKSDLEYNEKSLRLDQSTYSPIYRTITKTTNVLYQKRGPTNTMIQHLQDSFESSNMKTISTSPSGRLESLIKLNRRDIPPVFLNNSRIDDNIHSIEFTRKEEINISMPIISVESVTDELKNFIIDDGNMKENNCNVSNINLNHYDSGIKDSIFNVSDTVLQDITM